MKISTTAFAALVFTSIAGCNIGSKTKSSTDEFSISAITENKPLTETDQQSGFNTDTTKSPAPPPGDDKRKKEPDTGRPATPNPDWDKKIIKIATLNIEVKDFNTFNNSLREKIRSTGGYIAEEEQEQSDYKIENTVSIKVPVDQFDMALTQLTGNVEKINEKKVTSQDVTADYIDTRSRIEAKKQVREKYLDLLRQAKNMEEILSVQTEINGIQENIESATGHVQYLSHAAAYSTINLTYFQVLNPTAKDTGEPGFGARLSSAFRSGWSWVSDLFVGLISIWPLLLLIFSLLILFRRSGFRKIKESVGSTTNK